LGASLLGIVLDHGDRSVSVTDLRDEIAEWLTGYYGDTNDEMMAEIARSLLEDDHG
jgi:hypothetical protein